MVHTLLLYAREVGVPGDKVSRVPLQALHHLLAGQDFEVYKREIEPDVRIKTIENAARILERRFLPSPTRAENTQLFWQRGLREMHGDTLSEQLEDFINYGSRMSHNLVSPASDLVLKTRLLSGLSSIPGTSEVRAKFERMTLAEFESGARQAVRSLEDVGRNRNSAMVLGSDVGEALIRQYLNR
jgi:hypothetical protein